MFIEIKGNQHIFIHEYGEQTDRVPAQGYWINLNQFVSITFEETDKEHIINFKQFVSKDWNTLTTLISVRFTKYKESSEYEFQRVKQTIEAHTLRN